ncbi:hypothetical protein SISSUDRAFT_930715 [Sistotremastrum suecicum HHB10207 ss-3]|uniref:Methyltransferase domain-containing protein n=1 Tax=Sistotremastrum suecicum HHB10207 ss-3 TaxID=1314776 RepID=A0A166BQK5_9AGAM|nr:hypothetical protein SISSUDRAFT_930715 [Sistotremastrum suecicum HHB10207 ss-3]
MLMMRKHTMCRHLSLPWYRRSSAISQYQGVSQKKQHEIIQMTSLICSILRGTDIKHVVDIGAGQGYVTMELRRSRPDLHILALDTSDQQTTGAQKHQARFTSKSHPHIFSSNSGSLTRRTVFVTVETLHSSIRSWLHDLNTHDEKTPVLLIGLHACGPLTPTIMKTFLECSTPSPSRSWFAAGQLIIGCCYNLLQEADYPLSNMTKKAFSANVSRFVMGHDHLHLAAQTPMLWLSDTAASQDAALALRKVAFRALLAKLVHSVKSSEDAGIGLEPSSGEWVPPRSIGRLPDRVYVDFPTYVSAALQKHSPDPEISRIWTERVLSSRATPQEESTLLRRLEILHLLRCFLGPLVESLLVTDRFVALQETLENMIAGWGEKRTKLINVFDQATGSARNLALLVEPLPVAAEEM